MFLDQPTRVYVDTTIIAGGCDPGYKRWIKVLLDNFRTGMFKPVTSELVLAELSSAPDEVIDVLRDFLLCDPKILEITEKADTLAELYIQKKVLKDNYYCDLLHIALATLDEVDIFISLDHPNILHFTKVRSLIGVNLEYGLRPIQIRCPRLVVTDECESSKSDS